MAVLPLSVVDHYNQMQVLKAGLVVDGLHAWAQVKSTKNIVEAWPYHMGVLLQQTRQAQFDAAVLGAAYGGVALAEQGQWIAPTGFVNVDAFVGVASDGRSLEGLLQAPAYAAVRGANQGLSEYEALQCGKRRLALTLGTVAVDAARQSAGVMIAARPGTGYVRMLNPPSCARCAVLAGRFYRWNAGFLRHPGCDCVHVPSRVGSTDAAYDEGLVDDPYEYFAGLSIKDQDKLFTKFGAQAIRDGADIGQVVNARRGMTSTGVFTSEGMGKYGHARTLLKARQRRLMPEIIYRHAAGSPEAARALLVEHGYILSGGQNPAGVLRGQREGWGNFSRGAKTSKEAREAILRARETGVRDGSKWTMTAAEKRLAEAERDWADVLRGLNPFGPAAAQRRGDSVKGYFPPLPLTPAVAASVERRYMIALATGGEKVPSREMARAFRARGFN